MDQQVELLNLRLEECKKREEDLKKMNETIICSLSDFSHNGGNVTLFNHPPNYILSPHSIPSVKNT